MGNRRGEIVIISRVEASSVGDHHCCGAKTLFLHLEDTLALIGNHQRFRLNRSRLALGEGARGRSSISMEIAALTLAALSCSHS